MQMLPASSEQDQKPSLWKQVQAILVEEASYIVVVEELSLLDCSLRLFWKLVNLALIHRLASTFRIGDSSRCQFSLLFVQSIREPRSVQLCRREKNMEDWSRDLQADRPLVPKRDEDPQNETGLDDRRRHLYNACV